MGFGVVVLHIQPFHVVCSFVRDDGVFFMIGAVRLFQAAVLPHSFPHRRAPPAADCQRSEPVRVLGGHRR